MIHAPRPGNRPGPQSHSRAAGHGHAPDRSSAIDPLRLMLAVAVLALHTGLPDAAPALVRQGLVNGLYRLAVPVFALISGFFFLGAVRHGRAGAYLSRIVMLYALWMMLYLPRYAPAIEDARHAVQQVLVGYFHLWFLPGMILAAALIWALSRLGAGGRVIALVAGLAAAAGLGMQFLVLSGRIQIPLDYYRNGAFVIFPFFAVGYLLALWRDRLMAWRPSLGVVALALAAVVGESLWWFWIAGGGYGVDIMATLLIAAPVLFWAAFQRQGLADGKRIAGMAAFVYFIHIHVMFEASRLGLSGDTKFLFVLVVSLGLSWLLATIAGGRLIRAVT